jgi:hypothetical protein
MVRELRELVKILSHVRWLHLSIDLDWVLT